MNTWIIGRDLMKHHYAIKKLFSSKLKLKEISDEDYQHAQKLSEEFELKDLGEYHDLSWFQK